MLTSTAARASARSLATAVHAAASPHASPPTDDTVDVLIVGGSMVGLSLAAELGECVCVWRGRTSVRAPDIRFLFIDAQFFYRRAVFLNPPLPPSPATSPATRHLSVLVTDRAPAPDLATPLPPIPPLRVSTLAPASTALLSRVGAWPSLAPPTGAASPFDAMQVWDATQGGGGCVRYEAADRGGGWWPGAGVDAAPSPSSSSSSSTPSSSVLGHVADNDAIVRALLAAARSSPYPPAEAWGGELRELVLPPYSGRRAAGVPLARATLADGRSLTARLVVGADGAASRVRAAAGLRTYGHGYGRCAVVATVATLETHSTAWQRFLEGGPLALLPLRGGASGVVWTVRPSVAAQLTAMDGAAFAAAVDAAFSHGPPPRHGRYHPPPRVLPLPGAPSPASFPLRLLAAGRYVAPRVALVGDAARAVHPLAGQGANLGFSDAAALASTLAAGARAGVDPGDDAWLAAKYDEPRRAAARGMQVALDGLSTVFGPQTGPLASLRGLGLAAVDALPPLRAAVVRYASG